MIYISHLIKDEELKEIIARTGMGIESIEFSVAENLDNLVRTLRTYQKRLEFMECRELILHGPFLDLNPMAYDTLVVQATRTRYEQAYQAAVELGAKKLILHSGFIPSVYFLTGWAERMADFYKRFPVRLLESAWILVMQTVFPGQTVQNGRKHFCLISATFTFMITRETGTGIRHWVTEQFLMGRFWTCFVTGQKFPVQ